MRRQAFDGIIISHLGNTAGIQPELENTLPYVQKALKDGWHVCVNVIFRHGQFLLPTLRGYQHIPPAMLAKQRVWSRADDAETIDALCNINAHCFLQVDSALTLTSAQFVWTPPPFVLCPRAIAYLPETAEPGWLQNYEPAGLCSDTPTRYI